MLSFIYFCAVQLQFVESYCIVTAIQLPHGFISKRLLEVMSIFILYV